MDDIELLQELRREAEGNGPDIVWLELVTSVVCQAERKSAEEVADLIQDLFLHRLLRNRRALAIAHQASSVTHARNLIRMQLRQMKSDQREKGPAERVTNRFAEILAQRLPTFGERSTAGFGDAVQARRLSEQEIDSAAQVVLKWRRVPDEGEQRASMVFDGAVLREGVDPFLAVVGEGFFKSDIYDIFYRAFTALGLTAFIRNGDVDQLEADSSTLTAEEHQMVDGAVQELERTLSDYDVRVLTLWMTRERQEDRARELGISRPTLLKHQQSVKELTAQVLRDLPSAVGELALQELVGRSRYL